MNRWTHPDSYAGFSPENDYVLLGRHRDSDLIARHNWIEACNALNAQAYDDGNAGFNSRPACYHWRAHHWAVGWVEYLMIRADAPADIVAKAQAIADALENYPIYDETRYSDMEYSEVCAYWERCSVRERIGELHRAGLSIFAARRTSLPDDPDGALYETLREGL